MKKTFLANIQGGKAQWKNIDDLNKFLDKLEGKDIIVEIREKKGKRSIDQNEYYFSVVLQTIANEIGESDIYELHDLMKFRFLTQIMGLYPDYSKYGKQEALHVGRMLSTTDLTTKEFHDYIELIRSYYLQNRGIYVPDANEPPLPNN